MSSEAEPKEVHKETLMKESNEDHVRSEKPKHHDRTKAKEERRVIKKIKLDHEISDGYHLSL